MIIDDPGVSFGVDKETLTLGTEGVLVRVARDCCDAGNAEVKLGQAVTESRPLRERDNEGSEAAVDVQPTLVLACQGGQVFDGVDDTVGEVGGRTDNHNRVRVDEALHGLDVGLASARVDGHNVQLDAKVLRRLPKGGVGCGWNDPVVSSSSLPSLHLGDRDTLDRASPVTVSLDRHEDGLCSTRGRCPSVASKLQLNSLVPAPFSPWNSLSTIDTSSASILRTPGNTSGWRGFETINLDMASLITTFRSSPPCTVSFADVEPYMVDSAGDAPRTEVAAVKLGHVGPLLAEPLEVVTVLWELAHVLELNAGWELLGRNLALELYPRLGELLCDLRSRRRHAEHDPDDHLGVSLFK